VIAARATLVTPRQQEAALDEIRRLVADALTAAEATGDGTISERGARELARLWADNRYRGLDEFARTGRITTDARCELDEMDLDGCSPEDRAEWAQLRGYLRTHD
jgi:hypothetical protein